MEGQTLEMLEKDIEQALQYFDVISLNVFVPNTTDVKRDEELIKEFYSSDLYKKCIANKKIRVLDDLNRDKTDTFDMVGAKLEDIKEDK